MHGWCLCTGHEASASTGSTKPGTPWPAGSRTPLWHQSGPAWTEKLFSLLPPWPTGDVQLPCHYHLSFTEAEADPLWLGNAAGANEAVLWQS